VELPDETGVRESMEAAECKEERKRMKGIKRERKD
jgi:hypothetical protein